MTEKQAKAKLLQELREARFKCYAHEDMYSTGIPDVSASKHGRTAWIEVKMLDDSDLAIKPGDKFMGPGSVFVAEIDFARLHGTQQKGHFRERQSMELISLQGHARIAEYAVCYKPVKGSMVVAQVPAVIVQASYKSGKPAHIAFMRIEQWVKNLDEFMSQKMSQ